MLELLMKPEWLEKKPAVAFLLGFSYSIIGYVSARAIFGSNVGLMAVAFTSLLILPSINRLFAIESKKASCEKEINMRSLVKDHSHIIVTYICLFFGIFLFFLLVSMFTEQASLFKLFAPQLEVAGIQGGSFLNLTFGAILANNLIVLAVCFILTLFYGAGSAIFITWNASVWGVIFGLRIQHAAVSGNPFFIFFAFILPILPHLVTEATSYFSASIGGGILSSALLKEKGLRNKIMKKDRPFSKKFDKVLNDAMLFVIIGVILLIIAAAFEVFVFPQILSYLRAVF